MLDNTPVDVLTERNEGPLIVVNVAMGARPHRAKVVGADGVVVKASRPVRIPALGETLLRTMMIGSSDSITERAPDAYVITPASRGVGLLEFHQLDRMVEAGRSAARALLKEAGADLAGHLARAAEMGSETPDAAPVEVGAR